jgi:hypothetical protein
MSAPDRMTVPTCIGCGAMGRWGTCETGCSESRLDLVRADAYEQLVAKEPQARANADALRRVVERFAGERPPAGDEHAVEAAYRAVQLAARDVLRSTAAGGNDLPAPADPATVWWCERCGGVDAPQPCLGICVWRSVDWVSRSLYERERARALEAHEAEQRLRALLRRVAFVTPNPGQWERSWRALQAAAALESRGRGASRRRARRRSATRATLP